MKLRQSKLLKRARQQGFTLIELLIAVGLSMILLVTITNLFVSTISIKNEAEQNSVIGQASNYLISKLSYDIHRATDIIEPASLGLTSNQLQLLIEGGIVTYRVTDQKLYLVDTQGTHLIGGKGVNVSNILFKRVGNLDGKHAVELNMDLESEVLSKGEAEIRNYQSVMGIR